MTFAETTTKCRRVRFLLLARRRAVRLQAEPSLCIKTRRISLPFWPAATRTGPIKCCFWQAKKRRGRNFSKNNPGVSLVWTTTSKKILDHPGPVHSVAQQESIDTLKQHRKESSAPRGQLFAPKTSIRSQICKIFMWNFDR